MSGEHVGALSEELDGWLERTAEREGVDRETLIGRAVAAYRLVESADDPGEVGGDADGTLGRADPELQAEVDALADRVGDVEHDLDEKIGDVRSRVIQVKREADAKAGAEHDHPALDDRIDAATAEATAAAGAVSTLDERVERVERGLDNYEEVLDYLRDERDAFDRKAAGLASAVVDLRERTATLERDADARAALDDLRREAAREGVTRGDCGDCGSTVHLGLLGEPACPHCDAGLVGIEPGGRLFGSARLLAGDRSEGSGRTNAADGESEADDPRGAVESPPGQVFPDDAGTEAEPDAESDADPGSDSGSAPDPESDPDAGRQEARR